MKVFAPAKINLYLQVLGRDKNGYHRIRTVFQALELYDEISLSETGNNRIEITCFDKRGVIKALSGKQNIVYKAAAFLRQRQKVDKGVRIGIKKNIPVAAGLGGGSSDAAAVLLGLKKLWKLRIKRKELVNIAGKIGADVPFFLSGHTAMGEGYGDIVTPLPDMQRKRVLLVSPGFRVRAKWVYNKLNGRPKPVKPQGMKNRTYSVNKIKKMIKGDMKSLLFNKLEEVTIPRYPVIGRIKDFLVDNGACFSMMSGSGPAVFAFIEDEKTGIDLMKRTKKAFNCSSWLVETM